MSRASGSRRPRQANNDQLRAHGSELHAEAHLSEAQPPTPTLATSPSLLPVDLDREGLLPPSLQAGWRRKRTSEGLAAQAPSITRHRVDSGAAEEDVSGKISLQPRSEHEPTLPEAPALLPLARRSLRNTAPNHSTAASAAPPLPLRRSPRRLTRRLTDHDEHLTASSTDANRPAQSLSHWSPQRTPGLRSAAGKPGSIAGVEQQLGPSAGLSQRRQKQQHTRLSRRRAGGSRNTDMTDRRAELIQGGNRSSTPDNHGDQSQDDIMHLHRNPLLHTSSGDSSISLTSNSNRNGNGNSNSISGGGGPSPARGLLRHRRPLQEIPLWMADSRGEMIRRRSVMGTMSIGVGNGSRSNSGSDDLRLVHFAPNTRHRHSTLLQREQATIGTERADPGVISHQARSPSPSTSLTDRLIVMPTSLATRLATTHSDEGGNNPLESPSLQHTSVRPAPAITGPSAAPATRASVPSIDGATANNSAQGPAASACAERSFDTVSSMPGLGDTPDTSLDAAAGPSFMPATPPNSRALVLRRFAHGPLHARGTHDDIIDDDDGDPAMRDKENTPSPRRAMIGSAHVLASPRSPLARSPAGTLPTVTSPLRAVTSAMGGAAARYNKRMKSLAGDPGSAAESGDGEYGGPLIAGRWPQGL